MNSFDKYFISLLVPDLEAHTHTHTHCISYTFIFQLNVVKLDEINFLINFNSFIFVMIIQQVWKRKGVHCTHGVSWTLIFGGAKQGRRQDFGSGGGTLDKISYMNSSQVLYCNGVAKILVRGEHSAKLYSSKAFENFIKQLHKNLKHSPKFFKKNLIEFKKI